MNEIKRADLDRPTNKVIEHIEDALAHLHNTKFSEDDKTEIREFIELAAQRLAKAVRS